MLGVCGASLVSPGWLVLGITEGMGDIQMLEIRRCHPLPAEFSTSPPGETQPLHHLPELLQGDYAARTPCVIQAQTPRGDLCHAAVNALAWSLPCRIMAVPAALCIRWRCVTCIHPAVTAALLSKRQK